MATIHDVARVAGVSPTTVSHVLSNRRPVSAETKKKVLEAVEQTGYVPNAIAQGLVSQRTNVIGICFPVTEFVESNPSLVTLLFTGGRRLREHGYQLLIVTTPHDDIREFRRIALSGLLDGIILFEVLLEDPRVQCLQKHARVPFVLVGRCRNNDGISFVDIDSDEGVYQATTYLIELGHRRIVFVGGYPHGFTHSYYAHEGYKRALASKGVQYDPRLVKSARQSEEEAAAVLEELLGNQVAFSAMICLSEFVCMTMLKLLRARGMRVPEDVSLISFGNSRSCWMTDPALTAISLRFDTMTELAIDLLAGKLINDASEVRQVILPPSLEIRASTGPPSVQALRRAKTP